MADVNERAVWLAKKNAKRNNFLNGVLDEFLAEQLLRFSNACEQVVPEYEAVWLARNKPSCLQEITAVFRRLIGEARALAGKQRKT